MTYNDFLGTVIVVFFAIFAIAPIIYHAYKRNRISNLKEDYEYLSLANNALDEGEYFKAWGYLFYVKNLNTKEIQDRLNELQPPSTYCKLHLRNILYNFLFFFIFLQLLIEFLKFILFIKN